MRCVVESCAAVGARANAGMRQRAGRHQAADTGGDRWRTYAGCGGEGKGTCSRELLPPGKHWPGPTQRGRWERDGAWV